ncbi:MAG: hypothetical protein IT558_04005 [Alphaproteobacteria bacterium]|nr:hypothetical protein [Alphaproteobacteria bacterium]
MPREDRRVIFEHDETYRAIYALCVQREIAKPPPGRIIEITEKEDKPGRIFIKLENPQTQKTADLEYGEDFVAAALMVFCRGLRIPLPKTSKKSVMIVEGQMGLRVQI